MVARNTVQALEMIGQLLHDKSGALMLVAHDGNEDCSYNFGRGCDCSAPDRLMLRIVKATGRTYNYD